MIQNINFGLDKSQHPPFRLHSEHRRLSEGVGLRATHEGYLLQLILVVRIVACFAERYVSL